MKAKIKFNAAFLDFLINSLFLFFILSLFSANNATKITDKPNSPQKVEENLLHTPKLEIVNSKVILELPNKKEIKTNCNEISQILTYVKQEGTVLIKAKGVIPAECLNTAITTLAKAQITIYWSK